jgi:nickel transport protein
MNGKTVLLLLSVLLLSTPGPTWAHGAKIEYTVGLSVELQATYDTGEPMTAGQVTVYAPDDPATPWLTGVCDEDGRFVFAPDPDKPGTWDVQVRQAGHGDMVHIEIGAVAATSGSSGLTTPQILLMAACVAWGSIGTALFFSRKRGAEVPATPSVKTKEETGADAHP